MTKNEHTLQELLKKCNEDTPISKEEMEWEQMQAVGKEFGSKSDQNHQVEVGNINVKASVEILLKIVNAYKELGSDLECCDLANELGIILGGQCADKESLLRDFVSGFKHGVELSENTTVNERVSALYHSLTKGRG